MLRRPAPAILALLPLAGLGGCDDAATPPPTADAGGWFADVTATVGVDHPHDAGVGGAYRMPEIMGPGVGLIDYDHDGDLDLFTLQGFDLGRIANASAWTIDHANAANRLFRNDGPDGFTDVTDLAGVGHRGYAMGCAAGDYDQDGFVDLLVTNVGPNVLYHNQGDGSFRQVPIPDDARWSSSAAFFDGDGDGDLDLFICNYVGFGRADNPACFAPGGARDYCGPQVFPAAPDRYLRNDNGVFVDATIDAGFARAFGRGLGVRALDVNGDGAMDLIVANDGDPNQLWINQGDGAFVDDGLIAGAAYNADGQPEAGMGVAAGDVDGDGDDDIFLSHLLGETNTLLVNDGKGRFVDRTNAARLGGPSRPWTGFGTALVDIDLDGVLDIVVVNGGVAIHGATDAAWPYDQPNQLFRGRGDGTFADETKASVINVGPNRTSRGLAVGDLDRDGDVDLVVANTNGPVEILRNTRGDGAAWIGASLVPAPGGTMHGAVVTLEHNGRTMRRLADPGGSYGSTSDPRVRFGLGRIRTAATHELRVTWPSGRAETFAELTPQAYHTLREGEGTANE